MFALDVVALVIMLIVRWRKRNRRGVCVGGFEIPWNITFGDYITYIYNKMIFRQLDLCGEGFV